ncbi:MAG: DsrH/TusB family sulfur relay protein [Chloroflexi bacterium]|nr:DsrH/TusB family sulfur relay protein [Chloroflexota bacterium]
MEQRTRKIVLVRSAPGEALDAMNLARLLQSHGVQLTFVLIQDAVLCALTDSTLPAAQGLRALLAEGASCCYLLPDLAMRGFGPLDAAAGCEPLSYEGIVDVLMTDGAAVAGAY